ncbi:RagB/SusD family nutrient uptake outer membrane protein [Sphingobacterium puteale]|uniref:RagB/SusD family nutrient uptake outer membrane protein n=1 Tax=Sphingobacterium puteale TaxID=2420510 RepID=UPI003D957561
MKKYLFIIVLGATLSSCNKFLEQEPDARTKIDSPVKIKELVASAYPKSTYIAFAESMSDNAGDKGVSSRSEQNSFPWEFKDQVKSLYDMPARYWQECYKAIAAANQGLESIAELGNDPTLNASKGEALVARAYNHFMLVNFFARPYDESSSSTDPGIPYVEKPEVTALGKYSRGTVAAVYDNIERDLLAGIPLIDNSTYKSPAYHFTKNAAYAFATRFYLFKKDYANVVKYANLVASTGTIATSLRNWNGKYKDLAYYDLQAIYTKSTESANLLLCEANSIWGRSFAGYNYGLNSALLAEIFSAANNPVKIQLTYRSKIFGGTETVFNIPKFSENFIKETISANFGEPYNVIPLLTMEEVLFNRAEANANLGNNQAVIDDLNAFLSKRITGYNESNPNHKLTLAKVTSFYPNLSIKDALVESILNFKRQEYIFEGMRWFDIIRLKRTVNHRSVKGDINLTIGPEDNRRVLQLPTEVIASGLDKNPR